MQTIIAATDLSARSDLALRRAGRLAQAYGARLVLLHVVDDDQPADMIALELEAARHYLERGRVGDLTGATVRCETGDAFDVIGRVAAAEGADLIVVGAHRRKLLRDVFTGTTVERVIREAAIPVLMVNQVPGGEYRAPAVCVDLEEASAQAALAASRFGVLPRGASAVHAYPSLARLQLSIAGVDGADARTNLINEQAMMQQDLAGFLAQNGLSSLDLRPVVVEGTVPQAIIDWTRAQEIDLLVVGTRNRSGLPRMLLGSAAAALLNHASCDLLVVPTVG